MITKGEDYWRIRLQCTVCGQRCRRCRGDGNPPFGYEPPDTVVTVCYNCSARAEMPEGGVCTVHFVDLATLEELRDPRWAHLNREAAPEELP